MPRLPPVCTAAPVMLLVKSLGQNQVGAALAACPRAAVGLYQTVSTSPWCGAAAVPEEPGSLALIPSVTVGRNGARETPSGAKPCVLATKRRAGAPWCWVPCPQVCDGSPVVVQSSRPEQDQGWSRARAQPPSPVLAGLWSCCGQSSSHWVAPSMRIAKEAPHHPHGRADILLAVKATASPGTPQ